jgi:hypothetical protein
MICSGCETRGMGHSTFAVGSLEGLASLLADHGTLRRPDDADVVLVPTAAAFTGITEAAVAIAAAFDGYDLRVEALMAGDRLALSDPYFARRIGEADIVVLGDGSPLHARSVWRASDVGAAIDASTLLIAIGSVATVLGDVMIDPRGGAPTTGLGYRSGAALCLATGDEQMTRTRSLLAGDVALVTLGPTGIVHHDDNGWRIVRGDVIVTRGQDPATF